METAEPARNIRKPHLSNEGCSLESNDGFELCVV
jgi:hypothetical protein